MVSQEKLKYVCLSDSIFVNTQSILKIKRHVLIINVNMKKTLLQFLSYGGQQSSQPHVTVIKQMFRHQTICTFLLFV